MTIILVEDDTYTLQIYSEYFEAGGFRVLKAINLSQAKQVIENNVDAHAVILDVMLPPGDESGIETRGGFSSGVTLVRWIKQNYPDLTIIGLSNDPPNKIEEWFNSQGLVILDKKDYSPFELINRIKILISKEDRRKHLKIFIVHGHDQAAMYELKNYLQNTLNLSEPIILHEQPSLGRTIIEKFEEEARHVDLVFVLLTPDDFINDPSATNESRRRARQNVIFEMGYFFGKLQRKRGKVILLYKPPLELPTDISGVIYIDILNGIEAASEVIRREVDSLIKLF